MPINPEDNLKTFHFREIHPLVLIGTASDRYAGWIGQIYSQGRYEGRITKQTKIIAGKSFTEEVLPVDSVEEYFDHFQVLEIDFSFYRPLLDQDGQPTQNYQVLKNYSRHLKDGDRIILKVPQLITAQKIHKGDQLIENESYLNSKIFTDQFYETAIGLLGANLVGFILEVPLKEAKVKYADLHRQWETAPHTVCFSNGERLAVLRTRTLAAVEGVVQRHPDRTFGPHYPSP